MFGWIIVVIFYGKEVIKGEKINDKEGFGKRGCLMG